MGEAYIIEALRTPVGRRNGGLSSIRSDDLAGFIIRTLLDRTGVPHEDVEDVILGCVTQIREQGLNIARLAALSGGLPASVPGTSVNRQCASGAQAINFAAQGIMAGVHDLIVAGGVENMSMVPMLSDAAAISDLITRNYHIINQGLSSELIAERWGFTREKLDEFSFKSHQKAIRAQDEGRFGREIVPVPVPLDHHAIEGTEYTVEHLVEADEGVRRDTSLEKMARLRPAFKEGGVITAGNSSQISDGAAAVIIASEAKAKQLEKDLGLAPKARIVSIGVAAVDPTIMLTGPIPSTRKALEKAGLTINDIDLIEINEAFAPVPLACEVELGLDMDRVNVNGGAIALGHPLGCTGARLFTTLLYEMERQDVRYGLSTMCIGFGQGVTTIIERL